MLCEFVILIILRDHTKYPTTEEYLIIKIVAYFPQFTVFSSTYSRAVVLSMNSNSEMTV